MLAFSRNLKLTNKNRGFPLFLKGFGGSGLGAPGGLRSSRKICRATSFFICKSQCSSHFAAPFIVVRAEVSFAESCSLQAAMFITLRCALHRCSSRGIRRRELWHTSLRPSSLLELRHPSHSSLRPSLSLDTRHPSLKVVLRRSQCSPHFDNTIHI